MLKVLVFSYYWPPSGGPAVQRWLSLCEHLPAYGIEPILITVDEKFASYVLLDESLKDRIPENLRVLKTKSFEVLTMYQKLFGRKNLPTAGFANESNPSPVQKAMRWIRGNLFFPDPRKAWNKHALREARKIILEEDIKAIITAGPPQSTHLIGKKLKDEFNLFWVCDFHDAWTNVWYYDELKKSSWAQAIDRSMELDIIKSCDHILTVGRQIKADFSSKLQSDSKITIHSMGYDDDLFHGPIGINKETFVITYTGTMADNYEPQVFFEAIKSLMDEHPDFQPKVNLIGLISDGIRSIISSLNLADNVNSPGYMPHSVAVKELKNSCLLLLVSPNTVQSEMIIPGKIYEYLATQLPILNLATQRTETAEIIMSCESGRTFQRNQLIQIKEYIYAVFKKWQINPLDIVNTSEKFKQFSRATEAKKLAQFLKEELSEDVAVG